MDLLNQLQELLPKFKHYFAPASPKTNDEIRPPEVQPLLTVGRPDSRKGSQGEKFDPQKEQILFDEGSGSVDDDLQKLSAAVGKAMESFPDSDIAVDKGNMTDILEQEEMLPVTSATIIPSDLTTSKPFNDITNQTKPTEHVMETTAEVPDERMEPTTQDEKLPTVSSTMDKTDDGLKSNGTAIHYESVMETTSADPDNVGTRSVPTEELDNEGTVEGNEFSFPAKIMEQETDGMKGFPHQTTIIDQETDGEFPHPTTSIDQETDGGSPHPTTSMEQGTDGGSPHPTTSIEQETDGKFPHPTTSIDQETDGGSPHPTTSMEQETDGGFPHPTTSMEQETDGGFPHPTTSMEQETDGMKGFPHPTTSMEQETDGLKGSPHPTTSMEQETDGGSPHPTTSMEQETDGGSPHPTTSMEQETDGGSPHPTTSMEQETDGGFPHPTTSMEQETDGGFPHPTTSMEKETVEGKGSSLPSTSIEQETEKEHFEEELYPTMESSYTTEMDFSSGPNGGVNMRLNDKTTGGELMGTESTGGFKYPTEAEKVVEKQRIEEDLKARIGNEDQENEKDRNEERKRMDDRERIDMEQDGDTSPSEYQTRSQEYSVPPTSGFSGYLTTPDRSDYKQPDLSGPGGANLGDTFTSREDDYGGRGPRDEPEVPTMPAATPSEVDPRETIMTTRRRLNLYQLTRPGGRATDAPRVVRGERFWTSRKSIFPFICLPRGIIRGPTLCR